MRKIITILKKSFDKYIIYYYHVFIDNIEVCD